jgi:4-oxalocrotonate tautomerase
LENIKCGEKKMPFVEVKMVEGRGQDQKRQIVEGITKVICDTLGVGPDHVWVNIQDMPKTNFATSGKLRSDS